MTAYQKNSPNLFVFRILKRLFIFCAFLAGIYCFFAFNASPGDPGKAYPPAPTVRQYNDIADQAENGDAQSQLYIGIFYANGHIVPQNYTHAAAWYRKAAEQGNARAQRNLAVLYEYGLGVERNYSEAFNWYARSAGKKDAAAHIGIAGFHLTYMKSYMPEYFGNYNSWRLKAFYLSGLNSNIPDFETNFWRKYYENQTYFQDDGLIFREIEKRSREGDTDDLLCLAKMYFHGQGVARDVNKASRLVREASDKGNDYASFMLGATYLRNRLLKIDFSESEQLELLKKTSAFESEPYFAYRYYMRLCVPLVRRPPDDKREATIKYIDEGLSKLAREGHAYAQYGYGSFNQRIRGNYAEAWNWMEKAASAGNLKSRIHAGIYLFFGIGTDIDYDSGKKWLDEAFQANDTEELENMGGWLREQAKRNPAAKNALIQWLESIAESDPNACVILGMLYKSSNSDNPISASWFLKGVENGSSFAALMLSRPDLFPSFQESWLDSIDLNSNDSLASMLTTWNNIHFTRQDLLLIPAIRENYLPGVMEMLERVDMRMIAKGIASDSYYNFLDAVVNSPHWYTVKNFVSYDIAKLLTTHYWLHLFDSSMSEGRFDAEIFTQLMISYEDM